MFLLSSFSSDKFIIYLIPCLKNTEFFGIFWLNISLFIANNFVCVIDIKPGYIIKIISLYIIHSLYYRIILTTSIEEDALADCYSVGIWDCIFL